MERGRGRERALTLGGDRETGPRIGEAGPDETTELDDAGSASLYQPPVNVRAINWYSWGEGRLGSIASSDGARIHPTTHFSSSTTSAVEGLDGPAVIDMCADCAGMWYCAYDHSDSKYFGRGRNEVNGENVDCRFLQQCQ